MIIFKQKVALQYWLDLQRKKSLSIGFVPTMGALHTGHISLIETSKKENDISVSSIFVNPTQFNDKTDFEKYPITIEKDIVMLEEAGCDALFLPAVKEIYPDGYAMKAEYKLGDLELKLEGAFRPGHYQGVCMVVHRLLDTVIPDNLYLGQKDFQQCLVITKLIELIGHKGRIKVNICPTLRETDGLAMSSRNMRLNEKERNLAPAIFQTLSLIKNNQQKTDPLTLKNEARFKLEKAGFKVDYVEIADQVSLAGIHDWDDSKKAIVLIAAFLNDTRLIDNLLLD